MIWECLVKIYSFFYTSGFQVVKETLRMATIVSWFPRVALEDCEVEGKMPKEFA